MAFAYMVGLFCLYGRSLLTLWAVLHSEYTKVLVRNNQWVEFFIEGRRSRTGCVCVCVCVSVRVCE